MRDRILVAVPAIALIVFSLFENWTGGALFRGLVLVSSWLCALEYFELVKDKVGAWARRLGAGGVVLFVAAAALAPYHPKGFVLLLAVPAVLFFALALRQVGRHEFKGAVEEIALAFLPVFWLGFGFGALLFLKSVPDKGSWLVLYAFATVWLTDSFALFGGLLFGKHKLGLAASPKKSLEGTVSGLFAALAGAAGLKLAFPDAFSGWAILEWVPFLTLTALLSIVGQIGDLVESVVKRAAEVKDSGAAVPGHGGFLDVFDAQVFMTPVLYVITVLTGG